MRARRASGSVVPLEPNSRSNTARGLFSMGSGVVGVRQATVFVYAQLAPPSHEPSIAFDSIPSSSDVSWVCLPSSRAAIWSTDTAACTSAPRGELVRHAGQERPGRARVGRRRPFTMLAASSSRPPHSRTCSLRSPSDRSVGGSASSGPLPLRRPERHRHAVGHVEDAEPLDGRGGGPCRAPSGRGPCRRETAARAWFRGPATRSDAASASW